MVEKDRIREIISTLTLEEKAGLTSGKDNWFTKAVEHAGVVSVRTSDGSHGLRTQEGDVNTLAEGSSVKAVCFPAACLTAASFDRELLNELGKALGEEAQSLGVDVLLGPGVNIKRSPLCGRNFEYFSEDPYLAGELGAAYVKGVQSRQVGTSLKHFLANNQEYRRMDSSSELDERTMREIYLTAFERIVKEAKPWTVMASYNKVNGTYSTANKTTLTDILRKEWGFEGLVMSDWGAAHDRVAAVEAGCDITMPAEDTDKKIVEAVRSGRLPEEALDACCERILELSFRAAEGRRGGTFDYEGDHTLAQGIAENSIVLLKNEESILPLSRKQRIAFIGEFAQNPRLQGGGSSHINCYKISDALSAAKDFSSNVTYAKGYHGDGTTDEKLLGEAEACAKQADCVVIFIGLTDAMESEGVDRTHMRLSDGHNRLVGEVCKVNPNVIVVLHNGAPVEMPWIREVKGLLEVYLGGEAVGTAVARILFGEVNPSGHLPESFPVRLQDNPSYLFFGGENGRVCYNEGVFVGYRYYESKDQEVLFPFGYGLSYTTFEYSDLRVSREQIEEGESLSVSVKVTNTGDRPGKALVQFYVAPEKKEMIRPVRELKEFQKISLEPGESKEVNITLESRAFQYWSSRIHAWKAENADFAIQIGENAHDIVLKQKIHVNAEPLPPEGGYTLTLAMSEFAKNSKGYAFLDENIKYMITGMAAAGFIPKEAVERISQIPGGISLSVINQIAASQKTASEGGNGLATLLSQPLAILVNFLPEEKKMELDELINKLNDI